MGAVARASLATSKPLTGTGDSPLATSESEGKANGIPLTADLQDGYGERLEEAVRRLLELGGVGCNLEDWDRGRGGFYSVAEAAERVRRVVETAREVGVGGFVVNARCDGEFTVSFLFFVWGVLGLVFGVFGWMVWE